MHVQYGCGHHAPVEWLNFDASPTLRWERLPLLGRYTKNQHRFPESVRFGDIVTGLPTPDASCVGVYASHILEHLALNDFHTALRNTRKLLKPGGIFRLVVPDLEQAARNYLLKLDERDAAANFGFLTATCLGVTEKERGPLKAIWRGLRTSAHLWMWDELSMTNALRQHGFSQIRKCQFGDCKDPMFRLVEDPSRFEDALAIEAST